METKAKVLASTRLLQVHDKAFIDTIEWPMRREKP